MQQPHTGSPADPYRFISPLPYGDESSPSRMGYKRIRLLHPDRVKEPNDSYGEEGRSPKDYSSSLVRGTEGVAGFAADSWASR